MNKPSAYHFVQLYIPGRTSLMKSCLCEGVCNERKREAEKKGMGRTVKEKTRKVQGGSQRGKSA